MTYETQAEWHKALDETKASAKTPEMRIIYMSLSESYHTWKQVNGIKPANQHMVHRATLSRAGARQQAERRARYAK